MGTEKLTVDLRQWYMSMCDELHFSFDTIYRSLFQYFLIW